MTTTRKRVSFKSADGKVRSFTATIRKPGVGAAPARLRGYAKATKALGFIPKKGTEAHRKWKAIAARG